MINIYVAAPWEHKDKAAEARDVLIQKGFHVTSRWIDKLGPHSQSQEDVIKYKQEEALHDVEDVYEADVLILLNLSKSEGKAVETGLALAWQRPVIIVGERTNIFHHLPITRVDTLEEAIATINQWEADRQARIDEQIKAIGALQGE